MPTTISATAPALTFGNGVVQSYTYDPVSRLASLSNDLSGTANDLSSTFAYNPASQITTSTRSTAMPMRSPGWQLSTAITRRNGLNQLTAAGGASVQHTMRRAISPRTATKTYSLLVREPADCGIGQHVARLRSVPRGFIKSAGGGDDAVRL